MLESSSCVFPHRFHQIFAVVTNFAHIVPVLSSNSESIRKTGLVFAYELGFRRSIYQNRLEKISDPSIPHIIGVGDFYFGQKVVTRSSFRGHKVFIDFEQVFWKFHRPRLSLVWAHIFCGYFFCAPKLRKNIKKIKRKSQNFPKNNDNPKNRKKEG